MRDKVKKLLKLRNISLDSVLETLTNYYNSIGQLEEAKENRDKTIVKSVLDKLAASLETPLISESKE